MIYSDVTRGFGGCCVGDKMCENKGKAQHEKQNNTVLREM